MDIVVSDEETPFQDILLEQLAKIVAANSRSIWTQARERSGILPSGRSLLGSIVDPLGLFSTSPLVNTCETDDKTVETTRKLISLVRNQLSASNGGMVDISGLQQDEIIELSSILARKVWDRRVSLLKTGNRFATKLLQLTAGRLETGERIRRPHAQNKEITTDENEQKDESSLLESQDAVSSRLSAARDRLEELNRLEEKEEVMA